MRGATRTLGLALAATIVGVALVVTPCARHETWPAWVRAAAVVIHASASLVCHQRSERCFVACGRPWPVCARCAGLYAGGVMGTWIAWASVRRRGHTAPWCGTGRARASLWLTGALLALAWGVEAVGWVSLPLGARTVTALPIGAVAGWVAGRAAADVRG